MSHKWLYNFYARVPTLEHSYTSIQWCCNI